MIQNPVDAVAPLASAFERFGPAGAAVLGVIVVVGIFSWVLLRVHGLNLEHGTRQALELERILKTQTDELERMGETCHASHDQARLAFSKNLQLVVDSHEQRSSNFQSTLNNVVESNRRVETMLLQLVAELKSQRPTP